MKIARTPLYFGPEGRSLFGWFHAPAGETRGDLAVVICPPVGHEYVNSHRPVRHLAERLAEADIPVLRFDYDGTGNSAGRDEDTNRIGAWTQSVRDAIQTLREHSGCDRIGLAGIRLGATLAAAAATDIDVAFLALWAPCIRGRAYAREMKALHLTGAKSNSGTAAGQIEPGGFLMTEETQREISCLDLDGAIPKTKRALIITRGDLAEDTRLRDKWAAAGIMTEQRALPGFTEMFLPPHTAVVPNDAIAATVDWIRSNAGRALARPVGLNPDPHSHQRISPEVRESIVQSDGMFGILCEPATPSRGDLPTILMPNAGSVHHVGPNRLYVLLTRRLASAGFRCLRFDLPGLGDNVVDDIAKENVTYPPTSSSVVAAAIAAMRLRDSESFLLMGLCSGAHTSFHAALDLNDAPIVETMLINPLTFYYTAGMPLDITARAEPSSGLKNWIRSKANLERWAKRLRCSLRIALYRFRRIRPTTAVALTRIVRGSNGQRDDLVRDLGRIVESGRKLTFVYSRFDPGYDLLMINAASAVRRLKKKGLLRLWQIDDASHTFETKHSRDRMFDSVIRHLTERYVAGGSGLSEEVPRVDRSKLTSAAHEDLAMNRHLVAHRLDESGR